MSWRTAARPHPRRNCPVFLGSAARPTGETQGVPVTGRNPLAPSCGPAERDLAQRESGTCPENPAACVLHGNRIPRAPETAPEPTTAPCGDGHVLERRPDFTGRYRRGPAGTGPSRAGEPALLPGGAQTLSALLTSPDTQGYD